MLQEMIHPFFAHRRYYPSLLPEVEEVELYRPGGFHPVSIGDIFATGRYRVLHKLGFGGASTVWLARDQRYQEQTPLSASPGTLVALKILSAEESYRLMDETGAAELVIPNKLLDSILQLGRAAGDSDLTDRHIQVVKDHFTEEGPNGKHSCLVYPLSGPTVFSMSGCPGKIRGSKRLHGDLARNVAKQTSAVVELMHSIGLVHGDLTSSNILFQMSDQVCMWSDDQVYSKLGKPKTEQIVTINKSPLEPCAPHELVAPADFVRLSTIPSLLQESITIIDFGQSFFPNSKPLGYKPATAVNYASPETYFDHEYTAASDIWELACAIFEIRAGAPLFETYLSPSNVLPEVVSLLGKLPEPWWAVFEQQEQLLEKLRPKESQERESAIREELRRIGEQDDPLEEEEQGTMFETTGTRLEEEEVLLLGDLLEKMLRYRPEERITIQEVVRHPWFKYTSAL